MKRKQFFLLITLCLFSFMFKVHAAEPNISCPASANANERFTCKVTTEEKVNISSELKITKGSLVMSESGSIEFKADSAGKYDISLISSDYVTTYQTITVTIKEITTTKKTTTTTTTKAKSNNNYLSYIAIDGKEIEGFSKSETKYFVNVPYDTKKIKLTAKLEDENASYDISGPESLEVGDNEYTIGVTSEDDTTRFYKIIVKREEEIKAISTNVSDIYIKGYKLNFDGRSKTYHLKVLKNVQKLDIEVKLEDLDAEYKIEGNENLKDGSVIKIIVKNADSDTNTYRIIINKESENNYLPYIIGGIIVLILIFILIFVLIKKNRNKGNNKKANDKKVAKQPLEEKLEKTIEVEKTREEDNICDVDEEEQTKIISYPEDDDLEKTKVVDLSSELDKAFDDTFEN